LKGLYYDARSEKHQITPPKVIIAVYHLLLPCNVQFTEFTATGWQPNCS